MLATLYHPDQAPATVEAAGFTLPATSTDFTRDADRAAAALGCAPGLVDVLDSGPGYVAYSIFDFEGAPNPAAMSALAAISAHSYDIADDDQVLQGPVLVITA